jgi:hypothetical protein
MNDNTSVSTDIYFRDYSNDILEPDHDSYDLLDPFLLDPRKESLDPLLPEDPFLDSLLLFFVDEFLLLLLLLPQSGLPNSQMGKCMDIDMDIDISPVGIEVGPPVGGSVSSGCAVGGSLSTTGPAVGRLDGASVGAPVSESGQTPL